MSSALTHAVVGGGAGLAVWLCTLALVLLSGNGRLTRLRRLSTYAPEEQGRTRVEAEDVLASQIAARSFRQRIVKPVTLRLSRLTLRYAPSRIIATLQRQLDSAGNPARLAPHELLVGKTMGLTLGLLAGAASVGLVFSGEMARSLLYVAATAAAGFMLPDLWVYRRRREHLAGINRALPDVVDLLRVAMDGGLSYEGAVGYVVSKMRNPLSYELNRYLIDRQIGRGQDEALHAMGQRTREPDLLRLVEVVIQGEALGTGVARALNAFSADLRVKRRQRAETRAHQAAMKMMFPMILLIFPAVFIIILGPVVPIFMKSFGL